jgi:vitamin B12/bleomycin/antimicrobial peptide transport system ATP-binding/permease protein
VLDEATSALDAKSQDKMMQLVTEELPRATVVSVAHRAELEAFHRPLPAASQVVGCQVKAA